MQCDPRVPILPLISFTLLRYPPALYYPHVCLTYNSPHDRQGGPFPNIILSDRVRYPEYLLLISTNQLQPTNALNVDSILSI